MLTSETIDQQVRDIRLQVVDEYSQEHSAPWIIGYSGGKDSTLVTHLVFEMLLELPPSQRTRAVHVIANDTLVENPLVARYQKSSLREIEEAAVAFGLPIVTATTRPPPEQSYWVNLIGRGYPSPNRTFRWCTDRMKIQPTTRYIKTHVDRAGRVILLLGVRRTESVTRRKTVKRYDTNTRLHPHSDLTGCMVFRPIVELTTDAVWEFLACTPPPWGGSYTKLIELYRNASGGECPVVMQSSDAPTCGTTSSRFGCWTCTVVEKDRSLEGFVETGFLEFEPLLGFRDWLATIRSDPERRQARRRNGQITTKEDGRLIPGPFTLRARQEILARLKELERRTNQVLISEKEENLIQEQWAGEIGSYTTTKPVYVQEIKRRK